MAQAATQYRTFDELKALCSGRWPEIVSALAPGLRDAIESPKKKSDCPVHGGKGDFQLLRDFEETGGTRCWSPRCGMHSSGFSTIAWGNDDNLKNTTREVARYIDGGIIQPVNFTPPPPKPKVSSKENLQKILRIWNEGGLITPKAVPAMWYLENRGLSGLSHIPGMLRYHPALPYWEEYESYKYRIVGKFPAIIALATNGRGSIVTLHRTYLNTDGQQLDLGGDNKAKKWMACVYEGAAIGASVKLYRPDSVMAITEGIENALTVHLVYGIPVWPGLSASILPFIETPPWVKKVYVFADNDISQAGLIAAQEYDKNAQAKGIEVVIKMPVYDIKDGKGTDWNDVYRRHGASAFPSL